MAVSSTQEKRGQKIKGNSDRKEEETEQSQERWFRIQKIRFRVKLIRHGVTSAVFKKICVKI